MAGSGDENNLVTFDSAAGGLGRSGGACTPDGRPVLSDPDWPVRPTVAGRNVLGDSAFTGIPEARVDGVPSILHGGAIGSHGSAPWRAVTTQTPVGARALEVTVQNPSLPQGVIVYPAATTPITGDGLVAGELYSTSAYVLAPEGTKVVLTTRIVTASRGWVAELYAPQVEATGRWQRLTSTYRASAVHAGHHVAVQVQVPIGGAPSGTTVLVAGPQVEQGSRTAWEATP